MSDDVNIFENADFDYQRSRIERNPEAIEQRKRELAQRDRSIRAYLAKVAEEEEDIRG